MSSPIAKARKSILDRALIRLHQRLSHGRRVRTLAVAILNEISQAQSGRGGLRILDVGCGDMTIADQLLALDPSLTVQCVDLYPCPDGLARSDARWARYRQFDGVNLPFGSDSVDVVLFSDVLHHVPEPLRAPLLAEAARVGRLLVIKDHFEGGFYSRFVLRAMDFVGNSGYGVSVPRRYFDGARFEGLCLSAGLRQRSIRVGIALYDHLPVLRHLLRPQWQFIAVMQRPDQEP